MTTKTTYREPIGIGAIEYANQFTEGLTFEETAEIMHTLLNGELNDSTDKRVKRCDYCGYWWRDDSLRNTKRTCCDDCKRRLKTMQRRQERADKELLNPNPKPRKHRLTDDYVWWVEYPYWINEYSMIKIGWKYEKSMSISKMDYIKAQHEIYGYGNRKKPNVFADYNGDKRDQF